MSDATPSIPSIDPRHQEHDHDHDEPRRRRRHGFLAGLALGGLVCGAVGFAIGTATPAAEAALGVMARHRDPGPPSPERAKEHAEWFVSFALHRLDATDEQEEAILDRVGDAIDEAWPVTEQHRENRDRLRGLLAGDTIDRTALETLRAEELALADSLSRVVVDAVADSAEVLTAAQRAELAETIERFHHRH